MGSALRNVLEKVGLREPTAADYEDEYEEMEDAPLGEVHEFPRSTEVEAPEKPGVAVTEAPAPAQVIDRIKTSKPMSYSDAPEIGDYLRENVPVILNLNHMDKPEGQRMVDFVAGLCYGLEGQLEVVSDRVFLLTPKNIKTVNDTPQRSSFLPSKY